MPLYLDPVVVEPARVVSGISAGYAEHGVYRPDGSPVVSGTLVQGDQVAQGHASLDLLNAISESVNGDYVYGGCVYGHFGHLLLETCARLSVFTEFEKPVLFTSLNHTRDALFWQFADAVGLPMERIRIVATPAIVERLTVPPPDFRIRHGISLPFLRAFETLADAFAEKNGLRHNSNRMPVYLSRSRLTKGRRYFFGETLVEKSLKAQGCDIVYPEEMTLSEQITLAITRSHIIGFAGSAMHLLVFGRGRKRVTYLSTHPVHVNFWLIESLKRNHAQEVLVEACSTDVAPANSGPYLLSRAGIAAAASVLTHAFSENDVDAVAYAACVHDYNAALASLNADA
jgi:capsular polysaccharide biosynthesis protein